jgi:hypothetical protein
MKTAVALRRIAQILSAFSLFPGADLAKLSRCFGAMLILLAEHYE